MKSVRAKRTQHDLGTENVMDGRQVGKRKAGRRRHKEKIVGTKSKTMSMTKDERDRCDALFAIAESARRAELRKALRDPYMWAAQVVELMFALLKVTCLTLVIALGLMALMSLPEKMSIVVGVVPALLVLAANPRSFFGRNLFSQRAERAFNAALTSAL